MRWLTPLEAGLLPSVREASFRQVPVTSRCSSGRAPRQEKGLRGNVAWVGSKDQLAGGLRTSLILAETQPRGHSLAVSNYDKWHG